MQSWQYQQAMEIGKRELEKREHEREQTAQRARELDELRHLSASISRSLNGKNRPAGEAIFLSDEELAAVLDRPPLTDNHPLSATERAHLESQIAMAMGIREVSIDD